MINYATQRIDLGGKHVTEHLRSMLSEQGHDMSSISDLESLREMKEKLCYVVTNYEEAARESSET